MCLAKETLLAPGQLCSEVYLLVRGVLQGQPGEDGDTKSKKGGFKGKMLFRAIEKTVRHGSASLHSGTCRRDESIYSLCDLFAGLFGGHA